MYSNHPPPHAIYERVVNVSPAVAHGMHESGSDMTTTVNNALRHGQVHHYVDFANVGRGFLLNEQMMEDMDPEVQCWFKISHGPKQGSTVMCERYQIDMHITPDVTLCNVRKCGYCSTPQQKELVHAVMENFKKCSGCRKTYYCSSACQKAHWRTHKPVCMLRRRVKDDSLSTTASDN